MSNRIFIIEQKLYVNCAMRNLLHRIFKAKPATIAQLPKPYLRLNCHD